jgi:hypothetical protein
VRLFGGAREGKSFGDGAEVAKLVEFHGTVSRRKPRRKGHLAEASCVFSISAIGCTYPLYPN